MKPLTQKIFNCLCLLLFWQTADAQIYIDATGNWSYTIPVSNITEAGNNFTGTYSSNANQVLVDVAQQGFFANLLNYSWRVDVRKSDTDWNASLQLFAQRTGNGSPYFFTGTISGGTAYFQLTSTNQLFFSGTRTTLDIPIQYQIRNVSVLIPAKTYSTTIIYTVTEL